MGQVMIVSVLFIEGVRFEIAIQFAAYFVRGDKPMTFDGVPACPNTFRHVGDLDPNGGITLIKVIDGSDEFELMFQCQPYHNTPFGASDCEVVVVNQNGGFSPRYPFEFRINAERFTQYKES